METVTRKIQQKCLEILEIVDSICRKNHIQYSLCGGSVVGAHLYKGCLPWDDDIDIMMTRENYNRFVCVAPSSLPDGLVMKNFLLDKDFSRPFTKIINENTTLVQTDGNVTGVSLDITVYDKVPVNYFLRKLDLFLFNLSLTVTKGKLPGKTIKNRFRNFLLDTILSNRNTYLMFFQRIVEFCGHFKPYTYSELFGAWAQTYPYKPSIFENYTTIEFEGKQYMIVRDYVDYLETRYRRKDFRVPKEKQVAPHYKMVNFDLPYREYLKQIG